MVYVENAARAQLQAADALRPGARPAGRAYYLSQGEPVNCWQWIDQLLALAGLPPVDKSISLAAAWRLGAACEWFTTCWALRGEPPMTRFLAAQLGQSHYFDISAARADFGYSPLVATSAGMERLAGEWRRASSKPIAGQHFGRPTTAGALASRSRSRYAQRFYRMPPVAEFGPARPPRPLAPVRLSELPCF